jgi:hypothetical protein
MSSASTSTLCTITAIVDVQELSQIGQSLSISFKGRVKISDPLDISIPDLSLFDKELIYFDYFNVWRQDFFVGATVICVGLLAIQTEKDEKPFLMIKACTAIV